MFLERPEPIDVLPGLDFVAIDFETANRHRRSACSLGVVVVKNGIVTETKDWLIKPDPFEVEVFNQRVHGISEAMLVNCSTFLELWPEVEPYLRDQVLVAHNASFDIDVLSQLADFYDLSLNYEYEFCTHKATPWCWPEIGTSKLIDVSKHLGIDFQHHDARSDAFAAALIAIEMARKNNTVDLSSIYPQNVQKLRSNHQKTGSRTFFSTNIPADLTNLVFANVPIEEISWTSKKVCLTGDFTSYPDREDLIKKLVGLGAVKQSSINSKTEIAIIGKNAGPSKVAALKELISKGINILVLSDEHVTSIT